MVGGENTFCLILGVLGGECSGRLRQGQPSSHEMDSMRKMCRCVHLQVNPILAHSANITAPKRLLLHPTEVSLAKKTFVPLPGSKPQQCVGINSDLHLQIHELPEWSFQLLFCLQSILTGLGCLHCLVSFTEGVKTTCYSPDDIS